MATDPGNEDKVSQQSSRAARRVAGCCLLLVGCSVRQLIYPAPPVRVASPPPPLEEVALPVSDGMTVSAWHFPADALPPARPAVLFFHGNGENLETLRQAGLFHQFGSLRVGFLAVDYPGYGRSSGRPSEEANRQAAAAALDWLAKRYPERSLAVCGWSLGAAVAIRLAAERPDSLSGLVALSAWSSLPEVGEAHFPAWLVGLLLRERYDSLSVAGRIGLPALVLHGSVDEIIPVGQGRRVAEALPASRWIEVQGAGHNDLLSRDVVWREMARFFDGLVGERPP